MIDVAATLIEYGYLVMDLPPQSNKPVIATCDDCGKIRKNTKHQYRPLCVSCSGKGRKLTEESKALQSAAHEGKKMTEESKALLSASIKGKKNPNFGKRGAECSNFKGGKKLCTARTKAKRRGLGHKLLLPLKEGEAGHHFTDEDVIGIPEDIHIRFSGYIRKKHRQLILEWLKNNDTKKYERVLSVLGSTV